MFSKRLLCWLYRIINIYSASLKVFLELSSKGISSIVRSNDRFTIEDTHFEELIEEVNRPN